MGTHCNSLVTNKGERIFIYLPPTCVWSKLLIFVPLYRFLSFSYSNSKELLCLSTEPESILGSVSLFLQFLASTSSLLIFLEEPQFYLNAVEFMCFQFYVKKSFVTSNLVR